MTENFAKIVNDFKLVTNFARSFIRDYEKRLKYASRKSSRIERAVYRRSRLFITLLILLFMSSFSDNYLARFRLVCLQIDIVFVVKLLK